MQIAPTRTAEGAHRIAVLVAVIVLAIGFGFLRLRGMVPVAGAAGAWLFTLLLLWPSPAPRARLPKGISRAEYGALRRTLGEGIAAIEAVGHGLPRHARKPIAGLADGLRRIDRHLRRNPAHIGPTRVLIRHRLAEIVAAVEGYATLTRHDLPEHRARLAAVRAHLAALRDGLTQIERACLENDLTALEIGVEVLRDQIERRPRG